MSTAATTVPGPAPTTVLTPHGRLRLEPVEGAPELAADVARRLEKAFAEGDGAGLLHLGAAEVGTPLPAVLGYWRDLGALFVTALCTRPGIAEQAAKVALPPPPTTELTALASAAPPMTGAEYLTPAVLESLWHQMGWALRSELARTRLSVQELLRSWSPGWNLVGRVHFHLAENRLDPDAPFAFLATYTPRLSRHGRAQHLPLGEALREYAGPDKRQGLLSLLLPVQRAAAQLPWLRSMVDSAEIFHPLRWTAEEAYRLLTDVPRLEAAGVVVRVPREWRAGRPPRVQLTGTVGTKPPSELGAEALLDFKVELTLDGERLTLEEIRQLLRGTEGLAFMRGRWVAVDPARLTQMLERFEAALGAAEEGGVSFAEAMRLLAGADVTSDSLAAEADPDWSRMVAGPWLAGTLRSLRSPEGLARVDPGDALKTELRPYQQVGTRWLYLLSRLGLGACLADDMGLGKTIQVLALLLVRKAEEPDGRPSLLVAPASLLANWATEAARFAPDLKVVIAHPSVLPSAELRSLDGERLAGVDLVVTSYGSLLRYPFLEAERWNLVVLDEAQAIKNPSTRQARAAKKLQGRSRITLTGTPIENRLSDLWSVFDFTNPGLLGSAKDFTAYAKKLAERPHNPYEPLRALVRPYLLRRLKTDRSVIADLPEKTEMKAYCLLSRRQAALYQQSVKLLAEKIAGSEGIERKGLVLAFLTRFKQICNHPSHWLGEADWAEADSGKLVRLRGIAETVAARQEKVLVFTQFREATGPLAAFLAGVFGRPGLVLHGGTEVKRRRELVRRFQEDEATPFFVLSLRAGGHGLNLTAATHVVHFDRWWNPAVEDQATDRAFRIGQKKNVLVHKLLCRGTVEEKVDRLLESKQTLSREMLEGGGEVPLTEMSDEELLRLVSLDIHAASAHD